MTIIATYRIDHRAVYVNDFRVTIGQQKKQLDSSFKFIEFEERLGLFLAGDVNLWRKLKPTINTRIREISIDNVLDHEGPFRDGLQREVEKLPSDRYSKSGAIGFMIDNDRGQNVQFSLELSPGRGCDIEEIPIGECIVIGSGNSIPDIRNQLSIKFRSYLECIGEDLYRLGCGLRYEIQNIMRNCGPTSFAKLGISPCMCISTLDGSHFVISGEEITGESFSTSNYYKCSFSIAKNNNGQIALTDCITNREIIINDIDNTNTNVVGDTFDPQKLTYGHDPTKLFPDANIVYLLNQFVVPNNGLHRSLYKIEIILVCGERICNPYYSRIAENTIDGCSAETIWPHTDFDKIYFIIDEDNNIEFEQEVNARLFDQEWICTMIKSYSITNSE